MGHHKVSVHFCLRLDFSPQCWIPIQANASGLIQPCGDFNRTAQICGTNFYSVSGVPQANVCNMMAINAESDVEAAKAKLMSLYPPSINITLQVIVCSLID